MERLGGPDLDYVSFAEPSNTDKRLLAAEPVEVVGRIAWLLQEGNAESGRLSRVVDLERLGRRIVQGDREADQFAG